MILNKPYPLRLSGNYEVFSISYIESLKEGIKIAYFEVIISFSTYKTIIAHHKNKNYPHKMQVSCIFASELKQRAL